MRKMSHVTRHVHTPQVTCHTLQVIHVTRRKSHLIHATLCMSHVTCHTSYVKIHCGFYKKPFEYCNKNETDAPMLLKFRVLKPHPFLSECAKFRAANL